MSDVIDIKTKKEKQPDEEEDNLGMTKYLNEPFDGWIAYNDPITDLDMVNFFTHVATHLPPNSKSMFLKHFKTMNDFCELVMREGTQAIKQKLIDMGFFIMGDKK